MLHIRRETSGRPEVLGKPVVPRLRMAAWAGSTRHQEAIVAHCRRAHTELTRGQKRAASEAGVAGPKDGWRSIRCELAHTLAFARSVIFNTKNAIVLS
jgi:hypothetical protein